MKAILQYTSLPVRDEHGVEYDYLTQGTGSVNAAGAIEVAARIDPSRPLASWWLTQRRGRVDGHRRPDPVPGPRPSAGATRSAKARWCTSTSRRGPQNIVWGSDDNIVWGSSDNIVWGSNIVWGNNIVWGRQHRLGQQHRVGQQPDWRLGWNLRLVGNGGGVPSLTVWGDA